MSSDTPATIAAEPAPPGPDMVGPAMDWADRAEQGILDAALALAPDLGWSPTMLARAAGVAGYSPGEALLVMPNGPRDLAALMSARHDRAALAALAGVDPLALKVRERIRRAVEARLGAAEADAPAVRRWAGYLALPHHLPLALRLTWQSADRLWRWAGDTATDENHYSKRATLAAILVGALAIRLHGGREAAGDYLNARIDNVMAFETWKAKFKPADLAKEVAGALGRLRYGRN